jgi:hypothetical protein
MEYLIIAVLKFVGGILFFIYGLPVIIETVCDLSSWVSGDTKQEDQCDYYTNIYNESEKFMYGRR